MIDTRAVKHYCSEPIQNIENYEQAVSDKSQTWDCHHRREEEGFTKNQLKEMGLYFNRPASELIFLTEYEHYKIHTIGKANPFYGKHHTNESIEKGRKKQIKDNIRGKRVFQYTPYGVLVAEYNSIMQASRKTGYDPSSISKCCRGRYKTYKGFVWSYKYIHSTKISPNPLF